MNYWDNRKAQISSLLTQATGYMNVQFRASSACDELNLLWSSTTTSAANRVASFQTAVAGKRNVLALACCGKWIVGAYTRNGFTAAPEQYASDCDAMLLRLVDENGKPAAERAANRHEAYATWWSAARGTFQFGAGQEAEWWVELASLSFTSACSRGQYVFGDASKKQ